MLNITITHDLRDDKTACRPAGELRVFVADGQGCHTPSSAQNLLAMIDAGPHFCPFCFSKPQAGGLTKINIRIGARGTWLHGGSDNHRGNRIYVDSDQQGCLGEIIIGRADDVLKATLKWSPSCKGCKGPEVAFIIFDATLKPRMRHIDSGVSAQPRCTAALIAL